MKNRYVSALIKTIIFLVIVHIILLVFGVFMGTNIGFLGLRMFWPHFSFGWMHFLISVVALAIVYFIIYAFFTDSNEIEDKNS